MTKKQRTIIFVFFFLFALLTYFQQPHIYTKTREVLASHNEQGAQKVELPISEDNLNTAGIALTFDDKNIDDWYSFLVLSNKYGAKATFYVSSFHTLNINQIIKLQVLQEAKNEIGCHTLNHLNALKLVGDKSLDYYIQTEIVSSKKLMEDKGFHVESFAYPYGAGNNEIDREVLKHFTTVRYTAYPPKDKKIKDMNSIYIKNKNEKVIQAVGIDNGYGHTFEEILEGIDRAHQNNEVIVLYGHGISNKPGKFKTNMDMLEAIIKYTQEKGMKFYTVSELGS